MKAVKVILLALVIATAFFCLGWIFMTAGCTSIVAECVQIVK